MRSGEKCRECGTAIPADSPEGFCAQCLLGLGLATDIEETVLIPESESKATTLPTEKPGDRIGRYRLLQEIGHGGCGVVYMAEQEEPVRRKVALKVIKLGMDTRQVVARFEAERQALALMDHSSIAKVLDAGATATGRPFFVMELVGGIKITDYCNQNQLTTRRRLDLFIQVCLAVQHAHQKGVIHRDLKPSNVLVAIQDGVPVPKVIDFGIAKATQGRLTDQTVFTAFEQFLGTPAYMSPEQAQLGGLDIDTRSDIYSLGVLLYELLTGKTPFDTKELVAAGLDEMRRTIREVEPVKPSTRLTQDLVAADVRRRTSRSESEESASSPRWLPSKELVHSVRGDLDWIVMKCLEKDRSRRYETANGLAKDIERHLNQETVVARPPSTIYRIHKFIRRNRLMAAATTAITTVLVLGIAGSTWQAAEQSRLRQEADAARKDALENLWSSHLSEARALRMSGQPGRQFDGLAVLKKAAAIRPTLALRNEAIAAMVLTDIRRSGDKKFTKAQNLITSASPFENYVVLNRDGAVSIRRVSDDREQWRLPPTVPLVVGQLAFSPDGKLLAVAHADHHVRVWDWAESVLAFDLDVAGRKSSELAFTRDGSRIAISDSDDISVYDVARREKLTSISLKGFAAPQSPLKVFFDPAGRMLALFLAGLRTNVFVVEIDSGKVVRTLPHQSSVMGTAGIAWHPDGHHLATVSADGWIYIWDATTGERLVSFQQDQTVSVAFSHQGNLLASSGWDGKTRLWEFPSCRQLVNIHESGNLLGFSPDDRRLVISTWDGTALIFFEIAPSQGLHTIRERQEGSSSPGDAATFNKQGRFLAYSAKDGVRLWDSEKHKEIGFPPAKDTFPIGFDAAELNLLLAGPEGLLRCPLTASTPGMIDMGTPTLVFAQRLSGGAISADGRLCAMADENGWRILRTDTFTEVARTGAQPGRDCAVFSPDGKFLATGAIHYPGVKVWHVETGELVKALPVDEDSIHPHVIVAFTPDGRHLVTATVEEYRFWKVGSWSLTRRVPQQPGNDLPARMAFSPDGRIFAGTHSRNVVRLHNAATGETLADLEAPNSKFVSSLVFNADGTQLFACESRDALRVWDLRALREQLAGMKLDWELPPYSTKTSDASASPIDTITAAPTEGAAPNSTR